MLISIVYCQKVACHGPVLLLQRPGSHPMSFRVGFLVKKNLYYENIIQLVLVNHWLCVTLAVDRILKNESLKTQKYVRTVLHKSWEPGSRCADVLLF